MALSQLQQSGPRIAMPIPRIQALKSYQTDLGENNANGTHDNQHSTEKTCEIQV